MPVTSFVLCYSFKVSNLPNGLLFLPSAVVHVGQNGFRCGARARRCSGTKREETRRFGPIRNTVFVQTLLGRLRRTGVEKRTKRTTPEIRHSGWKRRKISPLIQRPGIEIYTRLGFGEADKASGGGRRGLYKNESRPDGRCSRPANNSC